MAQRFGASSDGEKIIVAILALTASFGFTVAMLLCWRAHNSTAQMFEATSTRADTLQMVPRFLNMFVGLALTGGIVALWLRDIPFSISYRPARNDRFDTHAVPDIETKGGDLRAS